MGILYYCAKCGKAVEEKFGSGKFCSRACANARQHSKDTKSKMSESVKNYYKNHPEAKITLSINANLLNNKRWHKTESVYDSEQKYCRCGKKLSTKNKTGLCQKCLRTTDEGRAIISNNAKLSYKKVLAEGRFVGWKARNITSYAEQFWQKVLDNNGISYKKEFTVKYGEKPNEHYFLDFLIQKNNVNIDLEIDGKQHQYEDRKKHDEIRDKRLSDCGYIVYRIKWNEVNSEMGKLEMKEKINNFLKYLNSI